jgi:acyl carrier protein
MDTTLSPEQATAVQNVIAEVMSVSVEQVTPDAKFIEDLGADSLTIVELVLALEERFNITIPDEVSERCSTVGELHEALSALLERRG